jgi:glycerophosphoryl diester phosphodiesterase
MSFWGVLILMGTVLISCGHIQKTKGPRSFQVIAHRGASAYLPEHTLEATELAFEMGVDFIEPDLVLSRDNQLVVLHDIHLDTTTDIAQLFPDRARKDGRYYALDFTLRELKQLKVKRRINLKTGLQRYPSRRAFKEQVFRIPSFVEFIELVQRLNKEYGKDVKIIPEIKAPEYHQRAKRDITLRTLSVLRQYGYEQSGHAIIQCFYPPVLKRLKFELKTQIPLLQLVAENSWQESSADYSSILTKSGLKEVASYAKYLGVWLPQLYQVSGDSIELNKRLALIQNSGLKIFPYTYRAEEIPSVFKSKNDYIRFIRFDLGVDGIFADHPDHFINLRP